MKTKIRFLIVALLVLAAVGSGLWWHTHPAATDGVLMLYGNVDFRQASIAFNGSERIAEVLVEEGAVVKQGQVLARLDTSRLRPQLAQSEAAVAAQKAVLERLLNCSRKEDIAQARAQLRGYEAQLALLRQQLADAELRAPFEAIVQSRLLEPGEMAAPSKPVFSLATTGTKWVRAYIAEPDLSRVHNGSRAQIRIDSRPDRALAGWVGFISPVAEFTPKTVQTEDLRTSLVYEIRVFVPDADNALRLGMPATVKVLPDGEGAAAVPGQ
jgi:HlyD family secretion protein